MEIHRRTTGVIFTFVLFAAVAVAVRLIPHAPNMTPLGALALTAGIFLVGRWTWAIPLVVLFATDLVLGGYAWPVMLAVYGSFALVTWMGRVLHGSSRGTQVIVGACASSLLFFIVTNFAVWAFTPLYEKTWSGFMLAYTLAVPFYRNMLVGDFLYTSAFVAIVVSIEYCATIWLKKLEILNPKFETNSKS